MKKLWWRSGNHLVFIRLSDGGIGNIFFGLRLTYLTFVKIFHQYTTPMSPYKSIILFSCVSLLTISSQAQTLKTTLQELAAALPEVTDEKNTYTQQLTFDPDKPYRVTIDLAETALKDGKGKRFRYELNLAEVDKNLVRRVASTKMLAVSVKTKRTLNAIRFFQDDKQENYQSELELRAKDSDNMGVIEKLLKQAVPLAEALWEESLKIDLKDLAAVTSWLGKAIKPIEVGGTSYNQSFTGDGRSDLVKLQVETSTGKGTTSEVFRFSLADLLEQRITYDIKGLKISVEGATQRNLNLIRVDKDGQQKNYENSFQIQCADPDDAKRIVHVLQKAVPLAKESLKQVVKTPATKAEALKWIAANVKSFKGAKGDITQTIGTECATTVAVEIADEKKKVAYEYALDLGDLTDQEVKLAVKGMDISIGLQTQGNEKFVRVMKDGVQGNYANNLDIEVPDLETARLLESYLTYAIKACKQPAVPEDFPWLAKQVAAINTLTPEVTQEFTQQDGAASCKYNFRVNTTTAKSAQEELYEFNLKDMDATQIDLKIVGKNVFVELPVKGKQKLINFYKDGKPSFVEKVLFGVTGIAEGKKFRETLKGLVGGCK